MLLKIIIWHCLCKHFLLYSVSALHISCSLSMWVSVLVCGTLWSWRRPYPFMGMCHLSRQSHFEFRKPSPSGWTWESLTYTIVTWVVKGCINQSLGYWGRIVIFSKQFIPVHFRTQHQTNTGSPGGTGFRLGICPMEAIRGTGVGI